jgi:hypothetical protein
MPVLRTDKLRRFRTTRDDALRNHCAVFSSEPFMIILVPGADDTSSAGQSHEEKAKVERA